MTDTTPKAAAPSAPSTKISYCPHLDVYHFCHVDGTEYFFNTPQLEKSIEMYQREGDHKQAEFMAMLTALGRNFPHMETCFDETGKATLNEMPALPLPVVDAVEVKPSK